MQNKPIIQTVLLIIFSYSFGHIFETLTWKMRLNDIAGLIMLIPMLGVPLLIGVAYTNKYKIKMPLNHRVKIATYYFIILSVICLSLATLMMMNDTLKDVPIFNIHMIAPLLTITFIIFATSFCNYIMLAIGCALEFKRLKKYNLQES